MTDVRLINVCENLTRLNEQVYLFEDIQNVVEVNVTASFQGYYKKWSCFARQKTFRHEFHILTLKGT